MMGSLLMRGMLAGLVAGILAFGFARTFGEPQVDKAIAYEEQIAAAANEPAEPEVVSRETQAGIGLVTGVLAYSVAMGGIFSLVFASLYGRVGALSPRTLAAVLSIAAFVALVIVPDLKYPPNPPAVGNDDTIGVRTGLYFVMLAASVFGLSLAVVFARRLAGRWNIWNAAIAGGLAFVVFIAIVHMLLPSINEVPEDFSAQTLYDFRLATIGIQAIVWGVIGLAFGFLAEKALARSGNFRRLEGALR